MLFAVCAVAVCRVVCCDLIVHCFVKRVVYCVCDTRYCLTIVVWCVVCCVLFACGWFVVCCVMCVVCYLLYVLC